ncbi:antitoxin Xre-like helix-turn-helix domain-containing protein [Escherichia coli]|uniref:antitoxin Xre-like helix-turn-helix domain-containing protein n=1 Tax=Escherichia coli TaxID=562 RepID=UPI003D36E8F2
MPQSGRQSGLFRPSLMIDNDLRARQTLAKAAIRAAEWLGLDQEAIAALLGKHRRTRRRSARPDPDAP